jgi:hypothetical protein
MRRKGRWIEPGLLATRLQDRIDRLRRQRPPLDGAPLINAAEDRSGFDLRRDNPLLQGLNRTANENGMDPVFDRRRLGTADTERQTRKERGGSIPRIGVHCFLVDKILDP